MAILDPPTGVIKYIQKHLVGFFWSGQHWPRALVLYLPVHEGGQGLTAIGLLYERGHGLWPSEERWTAGT